MKQRGSKKAACRSTGENMRNIALMIAAATIFIGPMLRCAAADDVPTYDVRKSCKTDVQADPSGGDAAKCLADEQSARETLATQWTQFAPQARSRCVHTVGDLAGSQSYVELLSCLQMAQDVKGLHKD